MDEHNKLNNDVPSVASLSMTDFDEAEYRSYLDGLDLTDDQASELMRVVWSIMRMFVELRLPVDSCGQIVHGLIEQSAVEPDSLD